MNFRLVDKGWDSLLAVARKADPSVVRLVCPFIQRKPIERLLSHGRPKSIQVITRFSLDDFCEGVSDLRALRLLLKHGALVRGIRHLHAKMYLLGTGHAMVTSANLTDAALTRNHEFGFVAHEPAIVAECGRYFDGLWKRAGHDLTVAKVDEWEKKIGGHLAGGARPSGRPGLGDEGANAGFQFAPTAPPGWVAESEQSFVKLLGESRNRKPLDFEIIEEVRRAGCHWACTYPKNKRPRQVKDGAVMFLGRMAEDPNDIRVFGRAIGMRYVPGRDDATEADMKPPRDWKRQWPHYIRVHHAEFINGTLANGISLNALMDELGPECFASTQRNRIRGDGNINPRAAYKQKPAVKLSAAGHLWMNKRLEQALRTYGKQSASVMKSLDWPAVPSVGSGGGR